MLQYRRDLAGRSLNLVETTALLVGTSRITVFADIRHACSLESRNLIILCHCEDRLPVDSIFSLEFVKQRKNIAKLWGN